MRFTILGEVAALTSSGPVSLGSRLRVLLAGLLAHRNGEVSRNDLIAIVWGEESEPADAEATLRQYVSRLRRAFNDAETGAAGVIITTAGGYRLETPSGTVDADELSEMLAEGRRPSALEARFGGLPYGSYHDESWCRDEVAALTDLVSEIRSRPQTAIAAGSNQESAQPARPTGTIAFFFCEVEDSTELWAADGDSMANSLSRYDELVRRTVLEGNGSVFSSTGESLGAAFSRASSALLAAVQVQGRLEAVDWPGPSLKVRIGLHLGEAEERDGDYFGSAVNIAARVCSAGRGGQLLATEAMRTAVDVPGHDLGEHDLSGLDQPIRIWQMSDGEFPPLRGRHRDTSLPHSATALIGRDELVVDIRQQLDQHRLVTLTATGGSGKTRTAIAVAEAVVKHSSAVVWFADLARLSSGQEVVSVVAKLVGVDVSGSTAAEELGRFLAPRHALLVLDNCEHVIDSCAQLAAALLAIDGESRILATSRERLDVDGEHVVEVPPLLVEGFDSPAVDLFVERATAANPQVDLGHQADLVELCQQLDGLPLAIELAAARTIVLSIPELVAGLEDRFRLLSPGRRRRGQTLEATIDWSYELLDESEQRVFRTLGVFVGGFDVDAVAAVAGLDSADALDVIEALILKSMVHRPTADVGRLHLLETLRAYAEVKLATMDEMEQVRDAHVDYYSSAIGRPLSFYFYSLNFLIERGSDWPNIIAAARWAAEAERWIDTAWLLKASVALGSVLSSSAALLPAVEECIRHLDESRLADEVIHLKTNCFMDANDYSAAMEHSEKMATAPDRFTAYMATVFLAGLLIYRQPAEALRRLDAVIASRPDEPIDDHLINSTTLRVLLLAQLEEFDLCEQEIDRYFTIEDTHGIRQASGIAVVATGAVLAWLRGEIDEIHKPELISRYTLPDGSRPLITALVADMVFVLAAVASGSDDAEQRLQRYVSTALGARSDREYNSALVLLALLAYQEGDHDRTGQLLKSVGATLSAALLVVARELARRIKAEPFSIATLSEEQATADIVAEAARRGWELDAAGGQ